jgi:uncharacterized membrane protein
MDFRLSLYELADQHKLSPEDTRRLMQLGGLDAEPEQAAHKTAIGAAIAAAALGGLGIVMWIAANWDSFGRAGRFGLLQGFIVIMCIGALLRPAARAALGLLAFMAIGGLFAYFGQTYQTGADPWQLFALWAVLSLPLCLAVRSDVLWAPWALVAMSAVSLWVHAMSGNAWRASTADLGLHLLSWAISLALTFSLGPLLQRYTGAGVWAMRTGLFLTAVLIMSQALIGLFAQSIAPQYWLGLVALGAAAALFASPKMFDVFGLSAVGLALNVLLVGGIAYALFHKAAGADVGRLLVVGMLAAGLIAATVSLIMRLTRQYAGQGERA